MRCTALNRRFERGFSAIEMLMVIAVMGIISSMALLQLGAAQPAMKGDGAMRVILSQMRTARELAITQRRFMRVTFTAPNKIEIFREEVPGPATTLVAEAFLEGGVEYGVIDGVDDTPDTFGKATPVYFGVVTNVKFTPEGTFVNQDGQSTNGTVFLSVPDVARSARAVTVLGSTGRIRGYRWDGKNWKQV